jgi:signal transduction histidine kinase
MRSDAYDPLDPRLVLRAYAVLAITAGVALGAWGPLWFGSQAGVFPWDQAVLIRMCGAIIIGAGFCARGLASADAVASRRALSYFIAAHAVVWIKLVLQIAGPLQHPAAGKVAWILLAVILGLSYAAISQKTVRFAGLAAPRPTVTVEDTRAQYEQQIRQAAAQEERHRLARDLHDAVKQQIFAIQAAGAAAEARLDPDPAGAREALAQVRQSAREAMTEMEAMLDQLRAVPLENATLVEAIKKATEALAFRTGAEVDVRVESLPDSRTFEPGAHQAVFRVVQEALANVARHARARHVTVQLAAASGHLSVSVRDDGVGIDAARGASGMGMQTMRARAAEVGGRLEVTAAPDGGTVVTLDVPYRTLQVAAAERRRALTLAIVLGNATALTLLGLLTGGPAVTNVFVLLFGAAFAHNVMRYRRLRLREHLS